MLRTKIAVEHPGVATLMARLVSRDGAALVPARIRSIDYLVLDVNIRDAAERRRVAHYNAVPLDVQDVVFAEPQLEDAWSLDDIGYNFCHTLKLSNLHDAQRRRRKYFKLRYTITLMTGETTRVCFRVRMIQS